MRVVLNVGILLCLCGMLWAADPGKTYTIVLDRAAKVGDKYRISAEGVDQKEVNALPGGKKMNIESESLAMKLEAKVEVLQVDERGRPTAETITIVKCVKLANKKEYPLAVPGSVVDASVQDKKTQFEIKGEPVSEKLNAALDMASDLSTDSASPTNDESFGTQTPQHVGDRWDINTDLAAADLTKTIGIVVNKHDITGQTALKEALTVNGTPCMRVAALVVVKNIRPANLPASVEITSSTLTASMSTVLPVDPTLSSLESHMELSMRVISEGQPDPAVPAMTMEMEMTAKRSATIHYSKVE